MSSPTAPGAPRPLPGAVLPERPPLLRPRHGRVLGGVAEGVSRHLGVPVMAVRVFFVVTGVFFVGLVIYGFLWLTIPQGEQAGAPFHPRNIPKSLLLIGGVIVLGSLGASAFIGANIEPRVVLPVIAIGAGLLITWSMLDRSRREQWLAAGDLTRRESLVRIGIGSLLVLSGLALVASQGRGLSGIRDVAIATLVVLVGTALLAAPFVIRLWDDFRREQTARIRATEKADIAAHLHDSVLQTLALVQRRSDDPMAVQRLARAQERELRQWLYADESPAAATLASAVTAAAHEIEDMHGVPIDLVVTGDRPLDDDGAALVRAVREAMANAVRHAQPPVSAYVEVGQREVEAFVRDHGAGFDLDAVPSDRLGVRESIVGRMDRHGGSATVRRREDGTEVSLRLPLPEGAGPESRPEGSAEEVQS
ncbi:ATP-binding protein [Luteipulveratus mongoliensis]|uniref:Membrane protein n=1 Tax=Luteipulveratus mongoliensis TaxID=571913 RepID=A0A0K1JQH1_9MICO|nr:ATP-binding protein [Luteipulveratus mongoliensis]AKU18790.1 membrane protein [Luteipulveratus mongoliensis]